MPDAKALIPFVMLSYSEPSTYDWVDDKGNRRTVSQAEGGEQGDPLMPLLFSIGIQGALEEVSGSLEVRELLCAFLDDIYFGRIHFHPNTISSNDTFIQQQFHLMNFSSNDIFIQ